jgi:hypothetical protein
MNNLYNLSDYTRKEAVSTETDTEETAGVRQIRRNMKAFDKRMKRLSGERQAQNNHARINS